MIGISTKNYTITKNSAFLQQEKSSAKDEYIQNKAVLASKIKSVESYTTRIEKARQNLKKALIQGSLDADEYTDGIKQLESEWYMYFLEFLA